LGYKLPGTLGIPGQLADFSHCERDIFKLGTTNNNQIKSLENYSV